MDKIIKIIEHFGKDMQKVKAIEELSELMKELSKDLIGKGNKDNILEELADVYVMLQQVEDIYGFEPKAVKDMIDYKVQRTINYIEKESNDEK